MIAIAPSGGEGVARALREELDRARPPAFDEWRELFAGERGATDREATELFARASSLALAAKLVSALALPEAARRLLDRGVPLGRRLDLLEAGQLHQAGGVVGFVDGDPFGWHREVARRDRIDVVIDAWIERLAAAPRAGDGPARDLFKPAVQTIVPRSIRHALGEYYTPDALAERALDAAAWPVDAPLLDPTCGSGTFLVAALRRRLAAWPEARAARLVDGIFGIDLNPLAVVTARASLACALAPRISAGDAVRIAVVRGDALDEQPSTPRVPFVCGNPPWVKWSRLPRAYAARARRRCAELGLLDGRWVGGVELDLSAAIARVAIDRWLVPDGTLAFLLSGSLFTSAAAARFRRFRDARVILVEDYGTAPLFDGASTHTALLVARRGGETCYPVRYRAVDSDGRASELHAAPVPGAEGAPWIKAPPATLARWLGLLRGPDDRAPPAPYRARKGVTTDLNGVFFVRIVGDDPRGALVRNDPSLGDARDLPTVTLPVEREHLFPLLRGRGVAPFRATIDPEHHVLVPQRGMHGDPELPSTAPLAHAYLARFEPWLARRASYRRFQRGRAWWSIWSTGPYTFAAHKVAWREIVGARFAAARVGPRVVVPDHKVYFVPLASQDEAAYLTAILNAPTVAAAITSFAAARSLGARAIDYLPIPRFDADDPLHVEIARFGASESGPPDRDAAPRLDQAVTDCLAPRSLDRSA